MLFELSIHDVMTLQTACVVAQVRMAKNAESSERCANNRRLPKAERFSESLMARWYREREADFEAVSKVLGEGRELTTLAQAKEALDR